MPERRIAGSGRREGDPKPKPEEKRVAQRRGTVSQHVNHERRVSPKGRRNDDPEKPRDEAEPDRSHFLHRKVGAAAGHK